MSITPMVMKKFPSLEKQREQEIENLLGELEAKVFTLQGEASPGSSETTEAKPQRSTTKKSFSRSPHLTHKPLADNEALQALRDKLPQNKKQNHKN